MLRIAISLARMLPEMGSQGITARLAKRML
jgi:hypothetical protein